jgi:diacylglycerol kinase (ATP)
MNQPVLFVLNPFSGPPTKRLKPEQLLNMAQQMGINAEVIVTERAGHATEIAQEAVEQGRGVVVAVGGDGTVNEVARALQGSETRLGIIPRGSGNGLARHLEIPLTAERAMRVIADNHSAHIDTGKINGKPFFCTAGLGFDAYISGVFATSKKRGLAMYAKLTLERFQTYQPQPAIIKLNGLTLDTTLYVLAFANASQYGNNAYIAPMADIQDGLLDVCLIRQLGIKSALEIGYGLWRKTLATSSRTEYHKARQITVEFQQPCSFHTDGEFAGEGTHFEVELLPLSLPVIKPAQ